MVDQNVPGQQNSSSDLKSFNLYSGKAPVLLQIVAGLLWLGSAGLIVSGLLALVLSPIVGVIYLILAVLIIITAKSLFSMKKTALRNTIIVCAIIIVASLYSSISKDGSINYSGIISPIILLAIAYMYKDRFVR